MTEPQDAVANGELTGTGAGSIEHPSLQERIQNVLRLARSHKISLLTTLSYCFSYAGLGIALTGLGPTLLELVDLTNSSTTDIGYIITVRACGYLLGSMGGRLYDKFDGHKLLFIDVAVGTVVLAFVPFVSTVWGQGLAWFFFGLFMGNLDAGENTLIVWLWKDKVNPFLHLLHFSFGLGAVLSPLIIATLQDFSLFTQYIALAIPLGASAIPYLFLKRPKNPFLVEEAVEAEMKVVTATSDTSSGNGLTLEIKDRDHLLEAPSTTATATETISDVKTQKEGKKPALSPRFRIEVVVFAAMLLLLDVGAEMGFGGWIFTYCVQELNFSDHDAALANAVFWGSFTTGRAAGVGIATVATSKTMLYADILGCSVSLLVLLMFPASSAVLWVGCFAFGWSIATVYPTVISLPQNFGVEITGTDTSWMVVGASTGEMVVPLLVGTLQAHYSMRILVLIVLTVELLSGAVFTSLLVRAKCVKGETTKGCGWWQSRRRKSSSLISNDGSFVKLSEL